MKLLTRFASFFTATLLIFAIVFPRSAVGEEINSNPLSGEIQLGKSSVLPGELVEVRVKMNLAKDYHAYLERFKFIIEEPEQFKLDEFKISPTVEFKDTISKKMKTGIKDTATLTSRFEVPTSSKPGKQNLKFKLTYQACTEEHCLFPKSIYLETTVNIGTGSTTPTLSAAPTPSAAHPDALRDALAKGTLYTFVFVFFVGILTSLTPCIYPMIPITLAILGARTQGQSRLKGFLISLSYVHGIALTYAILGVIAASTGSLFGSALSNIYVVTAIALIFVAMALAMYGLFELQAPAFLRDRLGNAKTKSGFVGAFVTGMVAGIVASPCVGPVLVGILTYIAQSKNLVLGFLLLFTFAMGIGVLFIVLGTFSHLINRVPKSGAWMDLVKFIFGTMMVGVALYYVRPVYPEWLFQALVALAMILISSHFGAFEPVERLTEKTKIRKGTMLAMFWMGVFLGAMMLARLTGAQPAVGASVSSENFDSKVKPNWKKYSQEALNEAKAQGKPVIIDFFAEWCAACVELDHITFRDRTVVDMSDSFVMLKVDATSESDELGALKSLYGVMGLPTLIFFDSNGTIRRDLTLTGFEKADDFLERMKKVR